MHYQFSHQAAASQQPTPTLDTHRASQINPKQNGSRVQIQQNASLLCPKLGTMRGLAWVRSMAEGLASGQWTAAGGRTLLGSIQVFVDME